MRRFSFKRGLRFLRQGGRAWVVVRRLTDGSIQMEADDGELWNAREAETLRLCQTGQLTIDLENSPVHAPPVMTTRELSTYSMPIQQRARRRVAYLQRLLAEGELHFSAKAIIPRIQRIATELGDPNPPSPTSIYRWHCRYSVGSSITNLADRWEKQGRRRKWSDEIHRIIKEVIDTVLLNKQRYPRKAVCDSVAYQILQVNKGRAPAEQLKKPSRASLYRYMACLEEYELMQGRLGKAVAERRYRMVLGTQKAERILERVELDHTPINLLVYCDRSMLPMGKPWLTLAIDKHSRMIMGFYIGFRTPSAYAVLMCLTQAILPKDDLLAQYPDITLPWRARGIFEMLVSDNGMELHSDALMKACEEMGIQLQFCPAKVPEYKGAVERVLKTINHDLIHRLPGTVFSNVIERGDYDSENLACISFNTLLHLVTKWIVEIYNQTPHRGIGMPPAKKWDIGEQARIIEYPAEPAQLRVIFAHTAERRVFHYGVEVNGLRYNSPDLQVLRRRHGEALRVALKYHEDDVGYVHVLDADQKAYFDVPAIDQEYAAGLSLIQHELIRAQLREANQDPDSQAQLLLKKHELQEVIRAGTHSRKMADRKRRAVMAGLDSASVQQEVKRAPRKTPQSKQYADKLPEHLSDDLPEFRVDNRNRSDRGAV